MTQSSITAVRPFAIVVGFKFSDGGAHAFDQAAQMAQDIPAAALHLAHVFDSPLAQDDSEAMTQHLELYAREKAASLGGLASRTISIHLRFGEPAVEILRLAREADARLIVIGSGRHGVRARFSAPTAKRVIAAATCPVLVAGPAPPTVSPEVPEIEPPCTDCMATRRSTGGARWWCARHSDHARAVHTFSYHPDLPFETRDSQLGPTGL
jgi:nucleotide-binding universal stress UspA family protein